MVYLDLIVESIEYAFTPEEEREITQNPFNNLIMTELDTIDCIDDVLYVEIEKNQFIIAVISTFIGLQDAKNAHEKANKYDMSKLVACLNQTSMSIIDKKRIERMVIIPPSIDEVIALMGAMEYEYWDFFIKLIDIPLADNSLSEEEVTYLEKISNMCKKESEKLDQFIQDAFGYPEICGRRKK